MGVSDIFVFVADAIYDYALAADTMQDTDEDDETSEGNTHTHTYHTTPHANTPSNRVEIESREQRQISPSNTAGVNLLYAVYLTFSTLFYVNKLHSTFYNCSFYFTEVELTGAMLYNAM